jgi:hypothetical protein
VLVATSIFNRCRCIWVIHTDRDGCWYCDSLFHFTRSAWYVPFLVVFWPLIVAKTRLDRKYLMKQSNEIIDFSMQRKIFESNRDTYMSHTDHINY